MSIHGEYLVDGTVGVVLMLLALSVSLKVRRAGSIAGYGIASTLFLCGLTSFGLLRFLIYAVSLTPLQNVAAKIGRRCLLDPSAFYLFV